MCVRVCVCVCEGVCVRGGMWMCVKERIVEYNVCV